MGWQEIPILNFHMSTGSQIHLMKNHKSSRFYEVLSQNQTNIGGYTLKLPKYVKIINYFFLQRESYSKFT